MLLQALVKMDHREATAIAEERWIRGDVPPEGMWAREQIWTQALDPSRVATDPRLRQALQRFASDAVFGPSIVGSLVRAGETSAIGNLGAAIRQGGVLLESKEAFATQFVSAGAVGIEALEKLCREIPRDEVAVPALEALFDVYPENSVAIAEERLSRSLSASCVPAALLSFLQRNGRDPLTAIVRRLKELDCDRGRLRPREPIRLSDMEGDGPALLAGSDPMPRGPCRTALRTLFGIPDGDSAETGAEKKDSD